MLAANAQKNQGCEQLASSGVSTKINQLHSGPYVTNYQRERTAPRGKPGCINLTEPKQSATFGFAVPLLIHSIVFPRSRVPIQNLFDYLEGGYTVYQFLDDFLGITREQVNAVLIFAAEKALHDLGNE